MNCVRGIVSEADGDVVSGEPVDLIFAQNNDCCRFFASLRRFVFLLVFGLLITPIAGCIPLMEEPQAVLLPQQSTPQASTEEVESTLPPTFTPPADSTPQPTLSSITIEAISQPPDGKYLFVELWVNIDGSGNVPMTRIDFPGYTFNPDTGALKPFHSQPEPLLAADDWGLIGSGRSRHGDAGGGTSSQLIPFSTVPYTATIPLSTGTFAQYAEEMRDGFVELHTISNEGLLLAIIDGEQVALAPGESWVKEVTVSIATENFNGRYTIISAVTNYGWLDRTQITGQP